METVPATEGTNAAGAALARLGERVVFALRGGRPFTWGDVVEAARLSGEWDRFEQNARRGLAATSLVESDALVRADREFRYARGLVSGDELKQWLADWGLSIGEWRGYLRRSVARATAEPDDRRAPELESQPEVVVVDAVCSGFLERAARRLAEDAALAERAGSDTTDVAGILAAAEHERARPPGDDELEREFGRHIIDWSRVEFEVLEVESENAAKEAVLGITLDGHSLDEIASLSGGRAGRFKTLLADAPPELVLHLQSARAGEVVGPIRLAGGYALLRVRERRPLDPADGQLRERAQALLVGRAVEREVLGRVRWRDPAVR